MIITLQNVNTNKLHNELIRAGLIPLLVQSDAEKGQAIPANTRLTFAEGVDSAAIQTVISAHDPTPSPQPPTAEERLAALEAAMLEVVLNG